MVFFPPSGNFEADHSHLQFTRYLPAIYPLATDLLSREMAPEIREGLREYFMRVGYIQGIVEHS